MIFSILQVSRDRERWLLLSEILPCVVYCKNSYSHCPEIMKV